MASGACIYASRSRLAGVLPRPRSRKNPGGPTEDILDDVDGEVVLVGDPRDASTLAPELVSRR
jgi:hypothetical protein